MVLCIATVLSALALLYSVSFPGPRYRSYARVSITPFTNAVLNGTFLDQAFGAKRGVRVEQDGGTSMIRIAADAATADAARRFADDATQAFRTAVQQTYGGTVEIIDRGETPLRPYSLLRDDLWPRLERFLKRVGIKI